MRIATFEFSGSSFIYYSFHVKDDETGEYLYQEELIDPDTNDIAQGLITLLDKSVELGADVDAIVYEELENVVNVIARDLNKSGKVTFTIERATGGDIYNYPVPHTFVLHDEDAATDME